MRSTTFALSLLALSMTTGCAAVFRGTKERVRVESDPAGADAIRNAQVIGQTPIDIDAERAGTTPVRLQKEGFAEHRGLVKKKLNAGWVTIDIVTCVFPIALCIPLIVDAVTGAWFDVDKRYTVTLTPGDATAPTASTTPAPTGTGTAPPAPDPTLDMSESERKATARAAYLEGVSLQEKNDCATALGRFEAAQKLFSAPTHLLHIAQCDVALGRLVEAQEAYETLVHIQLEKNAPEVFKQAQDEGNKALPQLKPRIPTLRIGLSPAPSSLSSLVIKVNGNQMPNELVGIARPVNPGSYKVTVWAAGYREASQSVDVKEGAAKSVDLKLTH